MPALSPLTMPRPVLASAARLTPPRSAAARLTPPRSVLASARLCAPLALVGLLLSGCGGAAAADRYAEPPPPPNDKNNTFTGSPSPTSLASTSPTDEAPSFMRVGDVARETAATAAATATATASAEPPKPVLPLPNKKGTKTLASKPLPAGAAPPADGGRGGGGGGGEGGRKPDTDADPASQSAPVTGVQAAVVDSASNLSEAEVRATIVGKQASFRECYDLGASGSAGAFSGAITLRVSIGPTGTVATVDVVTSTTKVAAVDSCVTQAVRRIQFPAKGNGAVVAFPIEFGK